MSFFRTLRTMRKNLGPRWQTDGEGGLVGYALDLVGDAFIRRAELGLLARLPQNDPSGLTTAPTDALTAMGRDRRVIRGINETDVAYAARLVTWLTDRRTAGNPYTLMRQLAAYTGAATGCSFRTVDVRGNFYSRAADGTESAVLNTALWDWDGEPTRWSRFWVIIYPGTLWTVEPYNWGDVGDPAWGADPKSDSTGTTATQEQVSTLRAIISDWKPQGTLCSHIILAFDPASFDPSAPEANDGLWGNWSKVVAGVRVPSRIESARYINGSVTT